MDLYKATGRRGEALRYFRTPVTHAVDVNGVVEDFFASESGARDFASQKACEGHDAIVVIATPYQPAEQPKARSARRSFAEQLETLFDTARPPGRKAYTPEDLADALHKEGIPLAGRLVERLLAGIGGPPPYTTVAAIARFFGVEPGSLIEDSSHANPRPDHRQSQTLGDVSHATRVYAKARNNDPAVPFNSRKGRFKSGRGFAVDIRVRDYDGAAPQRYAEGVIIGFWESEAKACRVAEDVNSGRHFGPEHQFHTRAHSAVVIPAWNASDQPGDVLPWETKQGSAEMVAAYESAGVPIPQWLLKVLARFDSDAGRVTEKSTAIPNTHDEDAAELNHVAPATSFDSPGASDLRTESLDGELLEMVLDAVKVGDVISTLGTGRPNRVVSIEAAGIRVSTEKSERKGAGPQLVPAWMIMAAWNHLRRHESLTQKQLVDELNVKRSAFVCALLSRFANVEFDAGRHVRLRLIQNITAPQEVVIGRYDAGREAETESSQQVSRNVDISPQAGAAEPAGYDGYAARLNRLFATVHPDERGPYSTAEVAESLQADGIPLLANSISRLREGVGVPPDEMVTEALAYFFNVGSDYFFDGSDFRDGVMEVSPISPGDEMSKEKEVNGTEAATDIRFSTVALLRITAGLSRAAHSAGRRPHTDLGLVRRMVSLIAEAGTFLQASLSDDVFVPVRYLEHVLVEWDATEPSDNGTEPDYRWLAELLNRHIDD